MLYNEQKSQKNSHNDIKYTSSQKYTNKCHLQSMLLSNKCYVYYIIHILAP